MHYLIITVMMLLCFSGIAGSSSNRRACYPKVHNLKYILKCTLMKPIFGGWRLMPSKSLVDYGENQANNFKKSKNRVTLLR